MLLIFKILLTALSIFVIGTHAVVGKNHFTSKKMPAGANLVSAAVIASLALYLLFLWTNTQPLWALLVALVFEGLALWLFHRTIAASRAGRLKFAFDIEHPETLVTSGPYRLVRHPFYTSYLVFWTGLAIGTWTIWAIPVLALIALMYTIAARGEERKFANSPMAAEYEAYRKRAGMFWPRLGAQ